MRNRIWDLSDRKGRSIPAGQKNLIICCGEKTEVNYFTVICKQIEGNYPQETKIKFDIHYDNVDPLRMVNNVESINQEILKNNEYNNVWIVFDKDDFKEDNFDNAIKKIKSYNEKSKNTNFYALWSNQCFELWVLLHFEMLYSNIDRNDYFKKLKTLLGKYEKTEENLVGIILLKGGKVSKAMKNAKRLFEHHQNQTPSKSAPATNVVEFFEMYYNYLDEFIK